MIRIDKNIYINENKIKKITVLSNSYEIIMDKEKKCKIIRESRE